MNVDFRSCINNWCYQHGTMGQYTRCKRVSNNGRTCHNPEIKYGSTVGGKPGGWMMHWLDGNAGSGMLGIARWCKQLFPTLSIMNGTVIHKVTYSLIVILMYLDHQFDLTFYISPSLEDSTAILKICM